MNRRIGYPGLTFKRCLVLMLAGCYLVVLMQHGITRSQAQAPVASQERFDMLVRDDFFAGMMGDAVRLDRGMKYCEDVLAQNPRHAEALVWHGGGLLARAAQAYTRGDGELGGKLWHRGLAEMNDAVALAPDDIGVKIGRSATLIGLAQSGWDASDAQANALLKSALADYELVYERQRPVFAKLSSHSRGELLFGLASGWSILGAPMKATAYLHLIVKECHDTPYEAEARRWLQRGPRSVVQHDCIGCHVSRSK